ncbi:MAG: 16S rRNA (adenine(1518)-N(6)/adenine(1519)-N(6))-dimethyltransferase RsmA [Litorilinea sp.]
MHPLLAEARRLGLHPKRSLGQNFLLDDVHLDRIAQAAELVDTDTVLEIGPGLGVLTTRLAQQAARVIAVELDDRLIEYLETRLADYSNVQIVHGDILEVDPGQLISGAPTVSPSVAYKVVANLPYYITSAVLRHLLEAHARPTRAVVMVQKEVAERICATPGNLSLLAISVQFYAEPSIAHRVPARAFYPVPKVDSAVLRLDVRPQPAVTSVTPERYFRVVRAGFGQKRKQLGNSLSANLGLPKAQVVAALEAAHIDPRRRAETLSLAEWGELSRLV